MPLAIPEEHEDAIRALLGLSKEQRRRLLTSLSKAEPTLLISELAKSVSQQTEISDDITRPIVVMLASLYSARADSSLQEFSSDFLQAIKNLEGSPSPSGASFDEFREEIERFLSLDQSLGVTSKSLSVMTDHARAFWQCKILTDIRPVFESNAQKGPAAAVIIHTLEVTYIEDSFPKRFYVAMDSNDVRALQKVLERAIVKAQTLRQLLKKSDLPCLEPKERQ